MRSTGALEIMVRQYFSTVLRTHGAVDADMINLIRRMNEGIVNALIFWGVNPAYTWFDGQAFF